jgi:2-polyprenyl-6-methoxyphenol hydroxylase-like FAD-dependent oxidoreductase
VVEEILMSEGRVTGIRGHGKTGETVTEHARVVIGADGRHSSVARAVTPAMYNEKPPLVAAYYAYWSGLPMNGRFETYVRAHRGFAAIPTHDGLTLIVGGWPYAEFEANKQDLDHHHAKLFELAPAFAERVRGARRETRLVGAPTPNFFRKPFGPGWALVGDAGYLKDPITAQGITDGFRDAELLVTALDQALSGTRPFDAALGDYQATRDARALPIFEFTCQLATMEPPPPELQQVLGAVYGDQDAMDQFCRVNAGAMSPAEMFAPDNLGPIFERAGARAAAMAGVPVEVSDGPPV